ncbi:TPM domain-containing protein [Myroides injenensis]|uniref:TPM domain-containing protein n=1 Tax=Myroides injenensis TaxID=1183151 RepID=UPI0002881296|nr:TPM domain-containing protein [Myroides injenensis]
MATTRDFLSPQDEQEIVQAITDAEKGSSGEIRVHIETNSNKEPLERAKEVFFELGMDKTKDRNGVLFYICINSRFFVILGDEGIDKKVQNENFWEGTRELVINHFKQEKYKEGLILGITKAGKKLQLLFPDTSSSNNELPNEISKG